MTDYEWDETKRALNLRKHRLDFVDAWRVYDHPAKRTYPAPHPTEPREKALALIYGKLFALIYTPRADAVRVISFRRARPTEEKDYAESL